MEKRFIALAALFVVVIFFLVGGAISENCVEIAGCKQCWKTTQTVVNDQFLCGGNSSCLAQPRDQQNNAIVETIFCACATAKENGYADAAVNSKIENTLSAFAGYNITANELCGQPGVFLAKVSYA